MPYPIYYITRTIGKTNLSPPKLCVRNCVVDYKHPKVHRNE